MGIPNNIFAGIEMVPYEREFVKFADLVTEMVIANGRHATVEDEGDWKIINLLYKGWSIMYPHDVKDFERHMEDVRTHTFVEKGIIKEGEAMMQYLMEVPKPLHDMVCAIYPLQQWDRKFVYGLLERFPGFKAYEK